jgi:hypothetical protein
MVDGYAAACRAATGQVLILNSDDMEPPENWDALLSDQFSGLDPMERDFVVHVSTGWCDGPQASSIQILSRARYERLGYAMYPGYESLYADDDFLEHAYVDGVVIDGRSCCSRIVTGKSPGTRCMSTKTGARRSSSAASCWRSGAPGSLARSQQRKYSVLPGPRKGDDLCSCARRSPATVESRGAVVLR